MAEMQPALGWNLVGRTAPSSAGAGSAECLVCCPVLQCSKGISVAVSLTRLQLDREWKESSATSVLFPCPAMNPEMSLHSKPVMGAGEKEQQRLVRLLGQWQLATTLQNQAQNKTSAQRAFSPWWSFVCPGIWRPPQAAQSWEGLLKCRHHTTGNLQRLQGQLAQSASPALLQPFITGTMRAIFSPAQGTHTHTHTHALTNSIWKYSVKLFSSYFSAASKCHSITQSGCTRTQSWPYYNLI